MSVVGIDLGEKYSVVAVARRGGIDVVANEVSSRLTATMVSFTGKERHVGASAEPFAIGNAKNTVVGVKRLIGRSYDEVALQTEELPHYHYKTSKAEDGTVACHVQYNDEETIFTPTQIASMLLTKLKDTAEKANDGLKLADAVVSVPGYFTDAQRRALLDAAKIAGVNVLKLMNETTATALAWGITRKELPDESEGKKPLNVMFVDVGHSSTSVTIAAVAKGKLNIQASAYDRNLGGRSFDRVLFEKVATEFSAKYKIDIKSNPKACVRLMAAVDKAKKVLSSVPKTMINIECLMNDVDVSGTVERSDMEEAAADLIERFAVPVKKVLADAGLSAKDIDDVEFVGGASRIPSLAKVVSEILEGKTIGHMVNADESVARGCALQAAILSPLFRVREFAVSDVTPYGISVSWAPKNGSTDPAERTSTQVFAPGNVCPSTKMLTMYRSSAFDLSVGYSQPEDLPEGVESSIGRWTVSDMKATADGEDPKIKVKVRLDLHGVVNIAGATMIEEIEEEVPVKEEPKKEEPKKEEATVPAPAEGEAPAEPAADADAAPAADAEAAPAPADEAPKEEEAPAAPKTEIVKKTIRTECKVAGTGGGMTQAELDAAIAVEKVMAAQDREIVATANARNDVESYALEMRSKIRGGKLEPFVVPGTGDEFAAQLTAAEDWIYEDGEDASKDEYLAKLAELQKVGDPITERYNQSERRIEMIEHLEKTFAYWTEQANTKDEKFAHIEQEDRDKILAEIAATKEWLTTAVAAVEAQPKHEDPKTTVSDFARKAEALNNYCTPIMKKPKPAPKKEEKKEEEKKEEGEKKEGDEKAAEADSAQAEAPAADATPAEPSAAEAAPEAAAETPADN